jgi:hypothetical protein
MTKKTKKMKILLTAETEDKKTMLAKQHLILMLT